MSALFGVDCASPLTAAKAKALVSAGAKFVLRYHTIDKFKWKRLTAAEAKAIQEAGLKLGTVFQRSTSDALGGSAHGQRDGKQATIEARIAGQPPGTVIFFAVDFNAQAKDMDAIEAYLRAAAAALDGYKVGVYGHYGVIEEMAKRKSCQYFWQTYAWSGGRKSAHTHLYQYKNDTTLAGHSVDFNEAYSQDIFWDAAVGDHALSVEDANKLIRILQLHYGVVADLAGTKTANEIGEFRRLANKLRKASGQPEQ